MSTQGEEVCVALESDEDPHYAVVQSPLVRSRTWVQAPDTVSTDSGWRELFPDANGTGWNLTAHVSGDGRFNRKAG